MKEIRAQHGMYILETTEEEKIANMQEGIDYLLTDSSKESDSIPSAFDVLTAAAEKWREMTDATNGRTQESDSYPESHR